MKVKELLKMCTGNIQIVDVNAEYCCLTLDLSNSKDIDFLNDKYMSHLRNLLVTNMYASYGHLVIKCIGFEEFVNSVNFAYYLRKYSD